MYFSSTLVEKYAPSTVAYFCHDHSAFLSRSKNFPNLGKVFAKKSRISQKLCFFGATSSPKKAGFPKNYVFLVPRWCVAELMLYVFLVPRLRQKKPDFPKIMFFWCHDGVLPS
jgi:hypothetical protein